MGVERDLADAIVRCMPKREDALDRAADIVDKLRDFVDARITPKLFPTKAPERWGVWVTDPAESGWWEDEHGHPRAFTEHVARAGALWLDETHEPGVPRGCVTYEARPLSPLPPATVREWHEAAKAAYEITSKKLAVSMADHDFDLKRDAARIAEWLERAHQAECAGRLAAEREREEARRLHAVEVPAAQATIRGLQHQLRGERAAHAETKKLLDMRHDLLARTSKALGVQPGDGTGTLEEAARRAATAIELAWGIIANAYGGNWNDAPTEWRAAAEWWREEYST